MPERTHYAVLGIGSNATTEEIRRAYLLRVRVLHPDRFDPVQQLEEWTFANQALRDLNEAYAVVGDPERRAYYDATIGMARTARPSQRPSEPRTPGDTRPKPASESNAAPPRSQSRSGAPEYRATEERAAWKPATWNPESIITAMGGLAAVVGVVFLIAYHSGAIGQGGETSAKRQNSEVTPTTAPLDRQSSGAHAPANREPTSAVAEPAFQSGTHVAKPWTNGILTPGGFVPLTDRPAIEGKEQRRSDPCAIEDGDGTYTRPANGNQIEGGALAHGKCKLIVKNGLTEDAVVRIASPDGDTDRAMYVRGASLAVMENVLPGQYQVVFQTGRMWDPEAGEFKCIDGTNQFDKPAEFREILRENSISVSRIEVTLHKVSHGNARTHRLDRSAFRRLRKQVS